MSKIKKSELLDIIREQGAAITNLLQRVTLLEKPQLKQLGQSIFDGLDEKWRFAAINAAGRLMCSKTRMVHDEKYWLASSKSSDLFGGADGYDTTDWQNSLIERDTTKELTGSDLARAMLERGDKIVTCAVKNYEDELDSYDAIIAVSSDGKYYESTSNLWSFAVPINNQGEPLTASEAGL